MSDVAKDDQIKLPFGLLLANFVAKLLLVLPPLKLCQSLFSVGLHTTHSCNVRSAGLRHL
jgi:hypothetical protein